MEGRQSVEFGPRQAVYPTNYGYNGNDDRNGMGLDMNFGAKMWAEGLGFGTNIDVNLEYDHHFQQQPPQPQLMDDEFDMGKDMSFLEMLFQ